MARGLLSYFVELLTADETLIFCVRVPKTVQTYEL
jgi:hypothetical protein